MDSRDLNLKGIRPEISTAIVSENMSSDERFQNLVLRPILKFQNDLFIEVFRNYISKHKSVFYNFSLEKRVVYIENAIQKDIKFRNSLKGIVIGQFTVDEYLTYIENSSALNKRMMNLFKDRLISQIQLFENTEILKAV